MIGISGYARSGKDTFGETLQRILLKYGIKSKTYALATQLKVDISFLTESDFGINAFTKNEEEKKIIRPLLVGYGEAWRNFNPDHWIEILDSNLEPRTLPIITDIRYVNEADYVLENNGFLLNLSRSLEDGTFVQAANNEEKLNAPKVKEKCSYDLCWGTTKDPQIIDEIVESFVISILENKLESWKVTYPS